MVEKIAEANTDKTYTRDYMISSTSRSEDTIVYAMDTSRTSEQVVFRDTIKNIREREGFYLIAIEDKVDDQEDRYIVFKLI